MKAFLNSGESQQELRTSQPRVNSNNPISKAGRESECPETLLQRRYRKDQQAHERMFNMLSIREMQIKTTMRYHFILTRQAMTKKGNCW
jgi:hypothetical protein